MTPANGAAPPREPSLSRDIRLLREILTPRDSMLVVGLGVLAAIAEVVSVALLAPLLALVGVDPGGGAVQSFLDATRHVFASAGVQMTLGTVLVLYVGVVALQAAVAHVQVTASVRVRERSGLRLRSKLYSALTRMQWRAFAQRHSSEYAHLLTTEVDRVRLGAAEVLSLVSQTLVTAAYVFIAVRVSSPLAALALASGAVLLLGSRRYGGALRAGGEQLSRAMEQLHTSVTEHLANMKVAKSFGAEAQHARHFDAASRGVVSSWHLTGTAFASTRTVFTLGAAVLLAIVVYVGVTVFALSSAAILLLLYLFARLVPRLGAMQQGMHQVTHAIPAFGVVAAELERARHNAEPASASGQSEMRLERELELSSVSFGYEQDRPVLREVSLRIPAGSITALIGASGAGKTTIADLLLGLVLPESGSILVDGRPLAAGAIPAWRRSVAYVPQETVLFNDTIRNNLLWAVPGATDTELRAALAAADAGFVDGLPNGLDTVAGERGNRLSGGERQRIALARALLRSPQLLVLDEATSNLDVETEDRILGSIRALAGRIAIVLISHRLPTLRVADTIYVLEQGRIVEEGSWTTLSTGSGRLRRLLEPASA